MDRPRALIVGCGYVGRRLASQLNVDHSLHGIVRSTTHLQALRALHVEPLIIDLDHIDYRDLPPACYRGGVIYYFAPPPKTGESDMRLYHFLNVLSEVPATLIYISTTGVYGDLRGAMADESLPPNPQTDRARRRVSAEEITRVWCHERSVRRIVLRVPAIYGPGRLPLERIRKAEPTVFETEAPIINRVHVDDLAQVCIAAANKKDARGIYNVSDGNSYTLTAYLKRVALLANLPPPPQISLDAAHFSMSEEFLSYLGESRRIDNSRMVNELDVKLRYADIDAGIKASLAEELLYTNQ